jgi:hypothetical protein
VECYTSRTKLLGYLALTCVMVGMAYFSATRSDPIANFLGWLGVAFFGLGFIVFPVQLLRWGPVVLVNEMGIEDRRLRIGVILWEDITAISSDGVHFISITVKDPEKYLSRMSKWKRWVAELSRTYGFSPIFIGFVGVTPGIDEALKYIQFRWRDHSSIQAEEEQEESNQKGHFSPLDP